MMSAYIEPLILYVVLFLAGSITGQSAGEGTVAFSAFAELVRIFLYNIPSLALIWYLLLHKRSLKDWGIGPPGRTDLLPFLLALSALALIGLSIALIAPSMGEIPGMPEITAPASISAWIILFFSCLSTGYLEESFFRFYILSRRKALALGPAQAMFVSALLFALCHVYEGPWGFLNAALAGFTLAFIFVRYQSLHGIALAHGLYNLLAYALAAPG
jgi:membrane protease YdiL (CAAX protease family)